MVNKFIHIVTTLIKRGAVGSLIGLVTGIISGVIAGLLIGIVINDSRATLMSAVVIGGGIGSPIVGVFVSWLTGVADYKSQTGIEWGVVGAASAFLVAWLLRFNLATTAVFIAMYAVSAILVYRTVLVLFEDEPRVGRITLKSAVVYCINILSTSGVIYIVFKRLESIID